MALQSAHHRHLTKPNQLPALLSFWVRIAQFSCKACEMYVCSVCEVERRGNGGGSICGCCIQKYNSQDNRMARAQLEAESWKYSYTREQEECKKKLDEMKSNLDRMRNLSLKVKDMLDASFCDVTLETCDGGSFPAHRCILATWSPVFAKMFTSGFEEATKRSVVIQDTDSSTMSQLLEFMYSGELNLQAATVKELRLLAAADKYQVSELTAFLDTQLRKYLNNDIVFESWKAANLYNATLLKEASARHIYSKVSRESSAKILKEMLLGDDMDERVLAAEFLEKWWLSKEK